MADSSTDRAAAEDLDGPQVKVRVVSPHRILRNGRFLEDGDEFETNQVSADALIEDGQCEKVGRSRARS